MSDFLLPNDDGLPMRPSGRWVEIKLDYLARFINVFETAMKGKWRFRNYIDLMAGPGKDRIRGKNKVFLGSPLIALTTQYPFTGYFFVELVSKNVIASFFSPDTARENPISFKQSKICWVFNELLCSAFFRYMIQFLKSLKL